MNDQLKDLANSVSKTTVRATLITGQDDKGNEFAYRKYADHWFDIWRECKVTQTYINEFVLQRVVKVRFTDDFEMTRDEWIADGTPLELSVAAIAGKKLARELVPVNIDFTKVLRVTP